MLPCAWIRLVKEGRHHHSHGAKEDRVVEIRPQDGTAQSEKMREIKRVIDQEMGFVPLADGK